MPSLAQLLFRSRSTNATRVTSHRRPRRRSTVCLGPAEVLESRAMLAVSDASDSYGVAGWAGAFAPAGQNPGTSTVSAVTFDAAGNRYVGGSFSGDIDFDPGFKEEIRSAANGAFVAKLDSAGKFQSVITFDSSTEGFVEVDALAVSSGGKLGVAGSFSGSVDFDPSASGTQTRSGKGAFAVVLGTDTNWTWQNSLMTYQVSGSTAGVSRAAFANTTDLYLGGWARTDADASSDAFVLKTKFSGTGIEWSKSLGGTDAHPADLLATSSGVIVTATYSGPLATVSKAAPALLLPDQGGVAISLKSDGSFTGAMLFAEQAVFMPGTNGEPASMPIALSADGKTGYLATTTDNGEGGSSAIYAFKMTSTGIGSQLWMTATTDLFGENSPASMAAHVLRLANGNLYVGSTTIQMSGDAPQLSLAAIDPANGALKGSAVLAGGSIQALDAALTPDGTILLGGEFTGTAEFPTFGTYGNVPTLETDPDFSIGTGFIASVANPFQIIPTLRTPSTPVAGLSNYIDMVFPGLVSTTATGPSQYDPSYSTSVLPIGAFSLQRDSTNIPLTNVVAELQGERGTVGEPSDPVVGRYVSIRGLAALTTTPGTYKLSFDLSKLSAADRSQVAADLDGATIGTATATFTVVPPVALLTGQEGFAAALSAPYGEGDMFSPVNISDVVTDAAGLTYVAGTFTGTVDFDPSGGTSSRTSTQTTFTDEYTGETRTRDSADGFVAVYSDTGALSKVITFPGAGDVWLNHLVLDGAGKLVVTGFYSGDNDNLPASTDRTSSFVLSLDANTAAVSNVQALSSSVEYGSGVYITDLKRAADGTIYAVGSFGSDVTIGDTVLTADSQGNFIAAFSPSTSVDGGLVPIAASVVDPAALGFDYLQSLQLTVTSDGIPVIGAFGPNSGVGRFAIVLVGINTESFAQDWVETIVLPDQAGGYSYNGSLSISSGASGHVYVGIGTRIYDPFGSEPGYGPQLIGPSYVYAYEVEVETPADPGDPMSSFTQLWSDSSLEVSVDGYVGSVVSVSPGNDGSVYVSGSIHNAGIPYSYQDMQSRGSFLLKIDADDGTFDTTTDLLGSVGRSEYGEYQAASGKFVNFGYDEGFGFAVNGPAQSKAAPSFIKAPTNGTEFVSVLGNPFEFDGSIPTLALSAKSDTGESSSDRITNLLTPAFVGNAENGSLVTVYAQPLVSGVASGSPVKLGTAKASATDGSWSFTSATGAFKPGDWLVSATRTVSGMESKAAKITLSIDTTAPAAPGDLDLDEASDSFPEVILYGENPDTAALAAYLSDNITSITTPTITGTAEDGSRVTVFANSTQLGTAVASGGVWTLTSTVALKDGSYSITAKATDRAGNVGPASVKSGTGSLSITIDTKAPAAPSVPDLIAADDKGPSSTDNKTSVSTPTFVGTAEPFALVSVFATPVIEGQVDLSYTEFQGFAAADSKGAWSFKIPYGLYDGPWSITANATDKAGTPGVDSKGLRMEIRNFPPAPPTVALDSKSDSGVKGDALTNVTLPTFSGDAPLGVSVNVYRRSLADESFGVETFLGTAKVTATKGADTGKWSLTTGSKVPFTNGDWEVVARSADEFGSESEDAVTLLSVDTQAPLAPVFLDLDDSSDLGPVSDDNYTTDTRPMITGYAEPLSSVTVLANAIVLGTATADDGGYWSVKPSAALKDGTYAITAKATDIAGNVGAANAKTGTGSLSVTIDNAAPAAPSVPDLVAADDSGSSSTDNKTNVTAPTFAGTAEPFATVTLFVNGNQAGSATTGVKGAWSIKLNNSLPDGSYSVTASAVDRSGNKGVVSKALSPVVISTVRPADPTVALSQASDSGVKGDSITNSVTPAFSGDAPAGATVNLYRVQATSSDAPVLLGTAAVGASKTSRGTWSLTTSSKLAFTDNDWRVIAKTVDSFGNESLGAQMAVLTISRAAPTVSTWTQESAQSVVVTFNRPVTGLKASSLRYVGKLGTASVDLPLTDSKVTAVLGTAAVTAVNPLAGGYSDTWRITFGKTLATGQSFTLRLKASGSGVSDTIGNNLAADSSTTFAGPSV